VGLKALEAVQDQETMLWKVSEVLSAPIDKVDKTAEKVLKELKEANIDKRKLIKELAEKESVVGSANDCEAAIEVGDVSIVKRDFGESIEVDRMLRTGSEIIKRNEAAVTLFYGSDGKACRLMIMAGEIAVQKGVNANQTVKDAAPVFGGGGGGRPNFAQAGGTKPEKLKDAIAAAEDSIKKQLRR
ncbi:MAG: DHHA1 domain-containing protein, partial [Ignavibacteria bacterium]